MIGASRTSLAALREAVNARFDSADAAGLAADGQSILSFAGLLGRERTLRQTLADPAMVAGAKRGLLQRLLEGRVGAGAFDLIAETADRRWSTDRDMVDAMDEAGASLLLMSAEKDGRLDRVEEEIFRFGRIIDSNPDLQMALTNPAVDEQSKTAIVSQLLDGKADPLTVALLQTGDHRAPRPTGADRDGGSQRTCRTTARPGRRRGAHRDRAVRRAGIPPDRSPRADTPPRGATQRHCRPVHRGWPGGPGRR